MIAFFCSTPYQILLAMTIRREYHPDTAADIYLLDHFKGVGSVAERLTAEHIFRRVAILPSRDFASQFDTRRPTRQLRLIRYSASYHETVNRTFNLSSAAYSDVYLTYPDIATLLILKVLHDRNADTQVHMYEDGSGSYGDSLLRMGRGRRLFNVLSGHSYMNNPYTDFLYLRPELAKGDRPAPLRKLPPIDSFDAQHLDSINRIFAYDHDRDSLTSSTIFLEQPYSMELNAAILSVLDSLLFPNLLIKLHPRSDSSAWHGHLRHPSSGIPWEVITLNSRIEDQLLVSFFSSAATTGKLLFDLEPTVMFLYKLPQLRRYLSLPNQLIDFVVSFKATYRDPDRVVIPETIDEARHFVSSHINTY